MHNNNVLDAIIHVKIVMAHHNSIAVLADQNAILVLLAVKNAQMKIFVKNVNLGGIIGIINAHKVYHVILVVSIANLILNSVCNAVKIFFYMKGLVKLHVQLDTMVIVNFYARDAIKIV